MRQRRRRRYNVYRLWDHEAPPPPVVGGVANIGRVTVIHRAGAIYRGIYRAYREDISRIYRCRGRDALLLLGRGRGAPLLLGRGRGALLLLGRGRGAREGGLGRVGAAGDAGEGRVSTVTSTSTSTGTITGTSTSISTSTSTSNITSRAAPAASRPPVLGPELGEVGAVCPGQLAAAVTLGELRTGQWCGGLSVTYCYVVQHIVTNCTET